MEIIQIKAGLTTPKVILEAENGHFEITGKSNPEDVINFYQPILIWIDNYMKSPNSETVFDFKLTYYNTASSKIVLEIMKKLELLGATNSDVKIRWYFEEEDEDMEELGEDYDAIVDLPFEHIGCDFIDES